MNFQKHILITLNKIQKGQIYNTDYKIELALIIVESWLRPRHIRYAEYIFMAFGYNLTLGLCQARLRPYWDINLDTENTNLFRRICNMEDEMSNIKVVRHYLDINNLKNEAIDKIVSEYTGRESLYYVELVYRALNEIEKRYAFTYAKSPPAASLPRRAAR